MISKNPTLQDSLDLYCQGKLSDLYPFYTQLRQEDPVHWSEAFNGWLLARYADVKAALHDPRLVSNERVSANMDRLPETGIVDMRPFSRILAQWIINLDPPDHTRLRALVNKAFTPRLMESLRQSIQATVDQLLDAVEHNGEMEVLSDFAFPLSAIVISRMLGVPDQERDQFKQWTDDIHAFLGSTHLLPRQAELAQVGMLAIRDYIREIARRRREQPTTETTDLISTLLMAEERGDMLTEDELFALCINILIAGYETTMSLIANGLLLLLQNGDQLQALRNDPSLIGTGIEEFLRYETPLQNQDRVAREDLDIGGTPIRKGQRVILLLGSANRDAAQFPDPDRLDITRQDNAHLAFGYGIHFCVGAPLARVESQIAINTMLRRLPMLRLANTAVEWRENVAIRNPKTLWVTF
jgi:cytochrome P450